MRRIVLGKDLKVKGLVGLSSIRRDAEERGESAQDRWYEDAQASKASEVTGKHAEHHKGPHPLLSGDVILPTPYEGMIPRQSGCVKHCAILRVVA